MSLIWRKFYFTRLPIVEGVRVCKRDEIMYIWKGSHQVWEVKLLSNSNLDNLQRAKVWGNKRSGSKIMYLEEKSNLRHIMIGSIIVFV